MRKLLGREGFDLGEIESCSVKQILPKQAKKFDVKHLPCFN